MELLRKIQSQPVGTRKLIFWSIFVILAFTLLFFWLKSAQQRFAIFQKENFIKDLNLPDAELPDINVELEEDQLNNQQ